MKDSVVIFVVSLVLVGCVGWLVLRANGIHPFQPEGVTVQPEDEGSTQDRADAAKPEAGKPGEPKESDEPAPAVHRIKTEAEKEMPAVAYHSAAVVASPLKPEAVDYSSLRVQHSGPAPAVSTPAAAPPFPSVPQIKPGAEKSRITQLFGNPGLTATTGDHGHTFDTFVYHRDRGEVVTVIRFQDGRVASARTTP